jgi:superfamily II DNA or RNA helicase
MNQVGYEIQGGGCLMKEREEKPIQLSMEVEESPEHKQLKIDFEQLQEKYEALKIENNKLSAKIDILLGYQDSKPIVSNEAPIQFSKVTRKSPIEEKIRLYRDYFKGREDVYAVRTKNKKGEWDYYPKRTYLGKEKDKHLWGENYPLTDDVIKAHLMDEAPPVTVGIYPMLLDETCWFLAIDFDKSSWKEDATSFQATCHAMNIPCALERSRSGNGGHVWIFFKEPIPAKTARILGASLLTKTLEMRHQLGLDSYDRMFPNQDTLPKEKKLGNLIALPLQRIPGKQGNSLFIDEHYQPYNDQWIYLSSLRKLSLEDVKEIIKDADQNNEIFSISSFHKDENVESEPWKPKSPKKEMIEEKLPNKMKIVYANMLYIEKRGLTSSQINDFIRLAAFQNPEFYRAQAMRLRIRDIPRIINCSEEYPDHIALPRGCYDDLMDLLQKQEVEVELVDDRNAGASLDSQFHGQLRDEQQITVDKLLQNDTGILFATTGFGKTVIGIRMIAARATNVVILVHMKHLMELWREHISRNLNIPPKEIGMIGGGKSKKTGRIDIAMVQTVHARIESENILEEYGHIIIDECHHMSAFSFEKVLKQAKAKYVLGLTATLTRQDGHHPIVTMQCGPVRYKVNAKAQAELRPFDHVVIPRNTHFNVTESGKEFSIQEIFDQLIQDETRNELIFDDVLKALENKRSPIILTDRISHLENFEKKLKRFAKNVIVLRGGMGKKQWEAIQQQMKTIPPGEERLILATGRFIGEGFDDARLDTLFLAMPFAWTGILQQYAGRLHRLYEPKQEVQIYDYVDKEVPVLLRMYKKRLKGYKTMGYRHREMIE